MTSFPYFVSRINVCGNWYNTLYEVNGNLSYNVCAPPLVGKERGSAKPDLKLRSIGAQSGGLALRLNYYMAEQRAKRNGFGNVACQEAPDVRSTGWGMPSHNKNRVQMILIAGICHQSLYAVYECRIKNKS